MNELLKQQIKEAFKSYCERVGGQNKAARTLRNVSATTVSNILTGTPENGKWDLIADEMWRNVAAQIGFAAESWVITRTTVYNMLYALLNDAQSDIQGESGVHAIIGHAGCGKTGTAQKYVKENANAYHLVCSEYWNRKTFMLELLEVMGEDTSGSVNQLVHRAVKTLKSKECPLLILDEADKLSDQVLYFFITLYNQLEDYCGLVLMATDYLEKRIDKGVKNKRKGYNEIYSRVGRRFIELPGNTYEDIAGICTANGLTSNEVLQSIINDCESDLRRVKKLTKANIKKARKSGK
ncbi:AAA family ATPase [Dysgonomonas sp. Marseille-P4361]|uniref:AAA family ATPase n=1 Tax=Dysgonomonas sp. Marseille-P4361 TaxID=2161820 RepID=UPI000D55BBA8|nr:AAA family ATPase [Dysgonomonas sp. Marseille-P4361]